MDIFGFGTIFKAVGDAVGTVARAANPDAFRESERQAAAQSARATRSESDVAERRALAVRKREESEARKVEEARKAEEARKLDEARRVEMARLADAAQKAEESRRLWMYGAGVAVVGVGAGVYALTRGSKRGG